MTEEIVVQAQRLYPADLEWIRGLIEAHPHWHRTRLSREICQCWEWKDQVGRYKDLAPISLRLAEQGLDRALWQRLLHLYHYLSFTTRVGKSLSYLAWDREHQPVAAPLFGAAAWKVEGRDRFIGWSPPHRVAGNLC